MERFEDAAEQARITIQYFPQHVMAYNNLGYALTRMGKYDEAIVALKKALEIDPTLEKARVNLALVYQSTGQNVPQ